MLGRTVQLKSKDSWIVRQIITSLRTRGYEETAAPVKGRLSFTVWPSFPPRSAELPYKQWHIEWWEPEDS